MRSNKGVSIKCRTQAKSTANGDTFLVRIHCQDLREGFTTTNKAKTFIERAHNFFKWPGGPEFGYGYAWTTIEGWLIHMGIDQCCHPYAIDCIIKFCHSFQLPSFGSVVLEVFLEIADEYSYVPKQPRLHPRDDVVDEESSCFESHPKKLCI